MYAVVELGGKQVKMEVGAVIRVPVIPTTGKEVVFDRVLLVAKDNELKVGTPKLDNVKITCEVLDKELKGDKIKVFKYKRRKNFRKLIGHRQKFTVLRVTKIEI
ncbi:MAG: 50S ribosomal protein L21 [Spirochaetia bacterium]|nr:50S ribosomal protein L21 [Spirochaetia bacterium]